MFRGVLDVGAGKVTDAMALAAAREISAVARDRGLREDAILPRMDDAALVPRVSAAVGLRAIEQGIARVHSTKEELVGRAKEMISLARAASERQADVGSAAIAVMSR